MNAYIKHRFLLLLPVLLGITFFTFVLMQLPADDTVDMMYKASGAVSETVKAAARAELGLDRPLLVRYLDWLLAVCGGDMGRSYISGTPVTALFTAKLPPTLYLTALALLLTACISVPLGIAAALKHNRCCDHLIRCCAFLGNSLPGFFIALLLLYCFALKLNFFPVLGGAGFGGLLLPALALAIPMSAKYIRHIRSNILEEINRDYVAGALVRGIPKATVFRRFILRSLGSTLITLLSLSAGSLLGGTAIIEMIFMIDGIGKMAMDAILMRDYPVVQAYVVWTALIFTCINLGTDLLLHRLEPQARQFTKGGGW